MPRPRWKHLVRPIGSVACPGRIGAANTVKAFTQTNLDETAAWLRFLVNDWHGIALPTRAAAVTTCVLPIHHQYSMSATPAQYQWVPNAVYLCSTRCCGPMPSNEWSPLHGLRPLHALRPPMGGGHLMSCGQPVGCGYPTDCGRPMGCGHFVDCGHLMGCGHAMCYDHSMVCGHRMGCGHLMGHAMGCRHPMGCGHPMGHSHHPTRRYHPIGGCDPTGCGDAMRWRERPCVRCGVRYTDIPTAALAHPHPFARQVSPSQASQPADTPTALAASSTAGATVSGSPFDSASSAQRAAASPSVASMLFGPGGAGLASPALGAPAVGGGSPRSRAGDQAVVGDMSAPAARQAAGAASPDSMSLIAARRRRLPPRRRLRRSPSHRLRRSHARDDHLPWPIRWPAQIPAPGLAPSSELR